MKETFAQLLQNQKYIEIGDLIWKEITTGDLVLATQLWRTLSLDEQKLCEVGWEGDISITDYIQRVTPTGVKHIYSSINKDETIYSVEEGDTIFCGGIEGKVYQEGILKFNNVPLNKLHTEVFMIKKRLTQPDLSV